MLLITFIACKGGNVPERNILTDPTRHVSESAWEKLSQKKIYFGHQSVGSNIIDGIRDVMKENPWIHLNIVESSDAGAFSTPVFAHSTVGQNTDPASKCDDFSRFMQKGIGDKADFALLKFCYVDITENTDVQKVFDTYKRSLDQLKEMYPRTKFIHVTVPLTSKQTGLKPFAKNLVKKILGRPVRSYKDNIRRNEFNELLIGEYAGREPIFDLAAVESTYPDGTREKMTIEGKAFYSLVPEYTYDGGHLNEVGRKIAAQHLLALLAQLSESSDR